MSVGRATEVEVLAYPAPRRDIASVTRVRSTWVLASLQALRERGHYDRYLALLPPQYHAEILFTVAGLWLPIDISVAHYTACQALGLSEDEQQRMGMNVGNRAQGTILATAVKMAKGAGVTPWTILPQFDRLWRRGLDGGAVAVFKTGPKEARIEVVACTLLEIPYWRAAFGGVLLDIASLFCQKAYIRAVTSRAAAKDECALRLQWA